MGLYFSRRQTTLDQYLLADRSMGWLPVGLSLMAALNSGMDYLMQPSATIRYGLVLAVGIVSWVPLYPWVAKVAFPFYHRLNFYSVYEYLEARFDLSVRTLAAMIFLLWRLGWMATAMYVPSLAVNAASGGQVDLNTMTIIVGVIVTMYTMLGGIQAVIWNDVIQFCIMFGGLAATVAIAWLSVPGGFGEIWSTASTAGKLEVWPPLVDPAAIGCRRRSAKLLSAADDGDHAAGGADCWTHGAIHHRPGDGAAPANHALGEGGPPGIRGECGRRRVVDDRPVVRRPRPVCVLSAPPAAKRIRDGQAVALFHVRRLSDRCGRPGDRRHHGRVAVEHRFGDQRLFVGGGRGSLQPSLERPRHPQCGAVRGIGSRAGDGRRGWQP